MFLSESGELLMERRLGRREGGLRGLGAESAAGRGGGQGERDRLVQEMNTLRPR